MIVQIVAAFFATIFFAVFFNVSRYELIFCGLNGAFGWLVYLVIFQYTESTIVSSFIAALLISIISHILARLRKNPVTVFQISGIIPLVPGIGMYRIIYFMVIKEYENAIEYFFQTLQVAGSIAMAMIIVASLNNTLLKYRCQRK